MWQARRREISEIAKTFIFQIEPSARNASLHCTKQALSLQACYVVIGREAPEEIGEKQMVACGEWGMEAVGKGGGGV